MPNKTGPQLRRRNQVTLVTTNQLPVQHFCCMENPLQQHWETVYKTKTTQQVSWTEEVPAQSLALITELNLPKDAAIVDIGGGDSKLVDHLLAQGYTNITVVDISAAALERAKVRLGDAAATVQWVVSDVLAFEPTQSFALWHDRAAFHFLTNPADVQRYLQLLEKNVAGNVIIAAFSTEGPSKCSGLPVQQYSEGSMCSLMEGRFHKLKCDTVTHITPSAARQEFVYCGFSKNQA